MLRLGLSYFSSLKDIKILWKLTDSMFWGQGKVRMDLGQPVLPDGMHMSIKCQRQCSKDIKANLQRLVTLQNKINYMMFNQNRLQLSRKKLFLMIHKRET